MERRVDLWSSHPTQDTSLPLASSVRQIDGLQMLRAVAVILVVLAHSGQELNRIGSRSLPNPGVFGIDIFFVISGFILSLTVLKQSSRPGLESMSEFMKRRFIRIYPIYWVIAALVVARLALSHQLLKHNYLPAFFLLPSLHYPSDPFILTFSWTMMFEVFFYLILGLILIGTIKRAVPLLIVLLSASTCIGAVVGIRHPIWIVAANPILLEFVFGAAIALLYAQLGARFGARSGHRRRAGIAATALGIAAVLYLTKHPLASVAIGFQMIIVDQGAFVRVFTWGICAALIVGGIVFWSPSMKSSAGRFFVLMGNSSYSAYLVSALVLEYGTRVFFRFAIPSHAIWSRLLYEAWMVAAVLAAGFACYVLIEKPLLRILQDKLLSRAAARRSGPDGSNPVESVAQVESVATKLPNPRSTV